MTGFDRKKILLISLFVILIILIIVFVFLSVSYLLKWGEALRPSQTTGEFPPSPATGFPPSPKI